MSTETLDKDKDKSANIEIFTLDGEEDVIEFFKRIFTR